MATYVVVVSFILIFSNKNLYYFLIYLIGFGSSARMAVGYVYLNELIPSKSIPMVSSIGLFFVSESVVMAAVYFWFISKDWRPFEMFGVCLAIFTLSSSLWIPESPKFLISQKRYEEAMDVFRKIARINKVDFNPMMLVVDKKQQ